MPPQSERFPHYEGESQLPGNLNDLELTEEEDIKVSELVRSGHSIGEAKKIVQSMRQARDEKALNENISPQRAEEELSEDKIN